MEGKMEGLEHKRGANVGYGGGAGKGAVRHPVQSKQLGQRAGDSQLREEEFK